MINIININNYMAFPHNHWLHTRWFNGDWTWYTPGSTYQSYQQNKSIKALLQSFNNRADNLIRKRWPSFKLRSLHKWK
jgi:hypothetical protein